MEKKNISRKQFRRISTIIITGLGVLVIALTLAVATLFYQSKENEKEVASIKHEMKPNMKKDGTFGESIYHKQPVKEFAGETKAEKLANTKANSISEMVLRMDMLELRLAKYDKKFGVNSMSPYTDGTTELLKDKNHEVDKYLKDYYTKEGNPQDVWTSRKGSLKDNLEVDTFYKKDKEKVLPRLPKNAQWINDMEVKYDE